MMPQPNDNRSMYADCQFCDAYEVFASRADLTASEWHKAEIEIGPATVKVAACAECAKERQDDKEANQ